MIHPLRLIACGVALLIVLPFHARRQIIAQTSPAALRAALTFHASFDGTADAVFAAGNPKVATAPSMSRRQESTPGLPVGGEAVLATGAGRFGDALRFTQRRKPAVYFEAGRNVAYQAANWSGTVSFWLSVDPAAELEPGFCDPIQITPRAWNDAAFFVEFEKRPESIPFRLGAYADLAVWNPEGRKFEDVLPAERPLIAVEQPPFGRAKWTHVVFTYDRFNTGQADGVVRLYLDGVAAGQLSGRTQTFTARLSRCRMWLAEGEGFEPPLRFPVERFSRPPVSTTHTSLQT